MLTPSRLANHSFPSADLPKCGLKVLTPPKASRTPSELSKSAARIIGFALSSLSTAAVQASNSEREIRTRPQAVYSHTESSWSDIQSTESQGNPPLLLLRV